MAETSITVDTDGVSGDYSSLSLAEAGEQTDLVTAGDNIVFTCQATTGVADSTDVLLSGWTTGVGNDIRVIGEIASDGVYSTSLYRLESTGVPFNISSGCYNVHFEQLQMYCTNTTSGERNLITIGSGSGQVGTHTIDKCIFRFNSSGTNIRRGVYLLSSGNAGSTIAITNSIFYGGVGASTVSIQHNNDADYTLTVTNITVYAMGYGVNATQTLNIKNSLIFNCVDDFNGAGVSATYCASDDSETGTGNFQITQTASDYAALVTDAPNGDFSVKDASSELYNAGTNTGAPSDDIIGTSRPQATTVDIGAFEFVAGGSTIQGVCADGFSLSESIGKAAIFSALAQESINLADSDQNIGSFLSAIADSLAMSDQATRTVNFPVVVSDNFTLTDSVIAEDLLAISALVNETINFSDTAVSRADFMAAVQENVALSDSSINLLSAIAQVTETLNISDAVFWASIQSAFVTDSLTISDQVTRIFQTFAYVAENFQVSESPNVTATFDVTVTDIVQFAEAISNIAAFRASVVDGFNVQATPMEVSMLPNGKVSVSFTLTTPGIEFDMKKPGAAMEMKTATIIFNIT